MCEQCIHKRFPAGRAVSHLVMTRHFRERCRERAISTCHAIAAVAYGSPTPRPGGAVSYRINDADGGWRMWVSLEVFGLVVVVSEGALVTAYRREVLSQPIGLRVELGRDCGTQR